MAESPELREVRAARGKAAAAREQLIAAMISARESGVSLRDVADAAGLSHEAVRTLTGKPQSA